MLTEALAALAANGGAALVAAMATDAWQAARDGMARLFGRQGSQRQAAIETQLDSNVVLVERAGDPAQARQGLVPLWQMELMQLLAEHPEAEAELRELVADLRDALPTTQQQWVQVVLTTIARDNSRQFTAVWGNVIYHESPSSAAGRQRPSPAEAEDSPGTVR
ncbi:hypothetical protein [Micromonospora globbae]|uniref:hypothetical protein n=1 Tax=Micromonospora globbae TaxID=1894969 RepID=UPI0037AA0777|nr:hypothetical protein OH732_15990 [Micromonospora globbae]